MAVSILLGILVIDGPTGFDARLHALALSHRTGFTVSGAHLVTQFGSWVGLSVITVALALLLVTRGGRSRVTQALLLIAAVVSAVFSRWLISDLLARTRPPMADWVGRAAGYSYPSGHTTAGTVAAAAILWTTYCLTARRDLRRAAWIIALTVALTVGWSRIWLGVHWPTDVIGGWLFGAGWMATVLAPIRTRTHRGEVQAVDSPQSPGPD